MEHNRYNQNSRFQRDYRHNPYNTESSQGRGQSHPDQRREHIGRYHGPTYSQDFETTFDDTGRETFDHPGPQQIRSHSQTTCELNPLEKKAKDFLHIVLNQEGIRSKLIFLETTENPLQTLQETADYFKIPLSINNNGTREYALFLDKELLVKSRFSDKKTAKHTLAQQALDILRQDCFYIIKKKEYEEISTKPNPTQVEYSTPPNFEGTKAHQMMLNMGWRGKGLGINQQGIVKPVAETIEENINKQGFGNVDVFKNIQKILEDYSKSDKMSLLRFDSGFTAEERAHIHKIAQRFGLQSKSEGLGEQRRLTVTKKLQRADLVVKLLICGLENSLYKLIIPPRFEHLWFQSD